MVVIMDYGMPTANNIIMYVSEEASITEPHHCVGYIMRQKGMLQIGLINS